MKLKIFKEFCEDKFMTLISNNILFEMAFDKKTMENKIRGLENQINIHLIKIIMYDDKINFTKHTNDIMNWLEQIQALDFNKKDRKFTKEQYFKLLFEEPITDSNNIKYIENKMRTLNRQYSSLTIKSQASYCLNKLYELHKEIASLLTKDDIMDFYYTLEKLDK